MAPAPPPKAPPPKTPPRKPGRQPKPPAPRRSEERARGALLGLAVGDAFGATNEFHRTSAPSFPKLAEGPLRDIQGGGPHSVKPGQVTDDTQMACCLANSLREKKVFDAGDVLKRYLAWKPLAFDIGRQTTEALDLASSPIHNVSTIGMEIWLRSARTCAGNGSLMRTAVLGVYFASDTAARIDATLADSAITHFDPRCQLACAFFNGAIAAAVRPSPKIDAARMIEAGTIELTQAAAQLGKAHPLFVRDVQGAVNVLKEDLAAAAQADPLLYGPHLWLHQTEGFVRVAFRLALWELLHAPSFEAALLDVVNRGGDADTNAAITGALLGACYGESAIPERWKTKVWEALGPPAPPTPLWETYHPRILLRLLDPS
jgi:ADP-ribosyl-[dinitrogen reductase] hydrolase